ncbi:MAG: hypothetical protein ACLPKB_07205, partial [Xanthobacteraceae bacterium]
LVWGVIIFACGFEGVASLLHGEWWQAVFGFGGMLGLTAMLIHWTRIRDNFADLRWLLAASMVALIVVALSPYVKQRRWPFTPTADLQAQFEETKRQLQEARERAKPLVPPGQTLVTGLQAAKELENLRSEVDELKRQNDALRRSQPLPAASLQLGPLKSLLIAKYIRNTPDRWAMFITYPTENQDFYSVLLGLLRDQINPWILGAPDNSTDLDAPQFPPPPNDPGITFYGDNSLNTQLSYILNQCFIVRKTTREISGLAEWFNRRLSEPERAENRKITWLEIGHGSPWLQGNRLSSDCLK